MAASPAGDLRRPRRLPTLPSPIQHPLDPLQCNLASVTGSL